MKLHKLPSVTKKKSKRLGRGYGSGKGGHTATRGQKGQKSRGSVSIWFEGGQLPFIRRFPFQRGKGRFKSLKKSSIIIKTNDLNQLSKNQTVTKDVLINAGIIDAKEAKYKPVKILSSGKINIPLVVKLATSKKAAKNIQAAGGRIEVENVLPSSDKTIKHSSKKSKVGSKKT